MSTSVAELLQGTWQPGCTLAAQPRILSQTIAIWPRNSQKCLKPAPSFKNRSKCLINSVLTGSFH